MADVSMFAPQPSGRGEAPQGEFVSFPDSPFQLFQPYPPAGDQPGDRATGEGIRDG